MNGSDRPVVFADANVLYPAQLRALLINLSIDTAIDLLGSDRVNREWTTALLRDRADITPAQVARSVEVMNSALPMATVSGYELHEERVHLPDRDDKHVLAAAIHAGSPRILTFNLVDFPNSVLEVHGIEAVEPDRFLSGLKTDALVAAARTSRRALRRPPIGSELYLSNLERMGLPDTAALLKARIGEL